MVASFASAKSLPRDVPRARGRGTLAETEDVIRVLVALLPGVLDGLRGVLGCHAAAGDLRGHIVDDATDRGAERLVEEVLMVLRARQVLGDGLHEGARQTRIGAADHRNEKVARRQLLLDIQRDEELE